MRLENFPNCCSAKILVGLGRTNTAAYDGGDRDEGEFFDKAKKLIGQAAREGNAMVFAITNSDQTLATKVLPLLGFVSTFEKVAKEKHDDKTLTSWVYRCTDEDAKPLAIPENPFAKPKPPVVEERQGVFFQGRPVLTTQPHHVYSYFTEESEIEVLAWATENNNQRATLNEQLRNTSAKRLPLAGKLYTYEELQNFFIPDGMRYRRIYEQNNGIVAFIASRKKGSGNGLNDLGYNRTAIAFSFA